MGVPVGEAEAAAGFGAADFFGLRGAVDAVTGEVESDPGRADWIVGAGLDDEFLGNAFALRRAAEDGGIEGVVGLIDAEFDAELAAGAFIDAACDTHGAVKEQAVFGAEYAECARGQSDLYVGRRLLDAKWRDVGDANTISRGKLIPVDAWVETRDEVGVALRLLRDHFQ